MRLLLSVFFFAVFVLFGIQLYRLNAERLKLEERLAALRAESAVLEKDNQSIGRDVTYYGEERNALKELRSSSQYRAPGEELIIVVPKRTP